MNGIVTKKGLSASEVIKAILEDPEETQRALSGVHLVATIVTKNGQRYHYYADENTDAARGESLTTSILNITEGETLIVSPGDYYMATLNLLLVERVTYQWNGARLYINETSNPRSGGEAALDAALFTSGFSVGPTSVSAWSFVGPLTLDGGHVTGKIGLWPIRGGNQLVTSVTFKNWAHSGFKSFLATDRGNRMTDCYFTENGVGARFEAEYWTVTNSTFHENTTGVEIAAGNTSFSNCAVTYNSGNGVKIMNASNGGHASWVGGNVNHHNSGGAVGVYVDPALTAFSFSFIGTQFHLTSFDLSGMGINVLGGEFRDVAFTMSAGTPTGVSHFRNVRYYSGLTTEATSLAALGSAKRAKIKLLGWRDENNTVPSFCDPDEFLPQAYTTTARDAISPTPTEGTIIRNSTTERLNVYVNGSWRNLGTENDYCALNGGNTISGSQNFTGQLKATGQTAAAPEDLMTRGLVTAQRMYVVLTANGTGVTSGTEVTFQTLSNIPAGVWRVTTTEIISGSATGSQSKCALALTNGTASGAKIRYMTNTQSIATVPINPATVIALAANAAATVEVVTGASSLICERAFLFTCTGNGSIAQQCATTTGTATPCIGSEILAILSSY